MQFKGNIFKFGVKWRDMENVRFSMENWPYLRNSDKWGQGCY